MGWSCDYAANINPNNTKWVDFFFLRRWVENYILHYVTHYINKYLNLYFESSSHVICLFVNEMIFLGWVENFKSSRFKIENLNFKNKIQIHAVRQKIKIAS